MYRLLTGILLLMLAFQAHADQTTVTLDAIADQDVRQSVPDYSKGDRTVHLVKNVDGDSAKLYIKFQLPADFDTAIDATFKIVRDNVGHPSSNMYFNLYGMNDDVVGNDWPELAPGEIPGQPYTSGITWNNAPVNDTVSNNGFTADAAGPFAEQIVLPPQNHFGVAGSVHTVSGQDLVDFLNTDTDRIVTVMISRVSYTSVSDLFASKESGTYTGPQLEITYVPRNLKTVALEPIADTDIREVAPTYAKSDRDVFLIHNKSGGAAKSYIKYQIPFDLIEVLSAQFEITRTFAGPWNYVYNLYGMNDDAAGNDWPELSPGEIPGQPYTAGLTWNNAPVNDTGSGDGFTADASGPLASFQVLGSNNGGSAPDIYTTAVSPALAQFINLDSDGVLTVMVTRQDVNNSNDLFATKEHATLEPPKLLLTYEAIETKTVTITAAADTDIRQAVPDYCKSNRDIWLAKNNTNDGIKSYFKFKLPADVESVLQAQFETTRKLAGAWNYEYNIHGLNDDVVGNDWPELSPGNIPGEPYTSGLTWNNAPGNDPNTTFGFNSDATDILATFSVIGYNNGGVAGGTYTASSAALADFLNTDTDSVVTLMVGRPGFSSSVDLFYSKDQTEDEPPKLTITYTPLCGVILPSDLNEDCVTDFGDLAAFGSDWLETDPNLVDNPRADINSDNQIDTEDLQLIGERWLNCTDPDFPECDVFWQPSILNSSKWDQWRQSWSSGFPIAAWSYFVRYDGTLAEYQTYADAGLTMVQCPIDQYQNAIDAGLYALIGSWENLYLDQAKLDTYIQFPDSQSMDVAGYLLKDEPKTQLLFDQLGQATSHIYYNDLRGAIPIVNLLPNYGSWPDFATYDDYVSAYVNTTQPAIMFYDNYSILSDGSDRPGFYDNIELIRQKALAEDIGFMGFALLNDHFSYRLPSESDLNWQVYSLIAYGAQGLWYYNYRIEPVSGFGEGMVTHSSGTPTSTYYLAQDINDELLVLGPTLMDLKTTGVYHVGAADPNNTTIDLYANGDVDVIDSFTGVDFILGEFENQDDPGDDATYIMITNKRHGATLTSAAGAADAIFSPNPSTLKVYQFNTATENWDLLAGPAAYTVNIGGGKGVLLKFSIN